MGDSVDRLVGLSGDRGFSSASPCQDHGAHRCCYQQPTNHESAPRLGLDCRFKPVAYLFRRVGDTGYALYGGDADFD